MKWLVPAALLASTGAAAPPVALHLNQVGFLPNAAKHVIVATTATAPVAWSLRDARGTTVARGTAAPFVPDAASGDRVFDLDLSGVRAPGRYRLSVEGATARLVEVGARVYQPLAKAALNFFYQQRAGTPILAAHAGGARWARPAGHEREIVGCFAGIDERGTAWPGCALRLDVTGGWYDAGDHGKYVVNGGIAAWTLVNAWEAAAAPHPFPNGSAALPEAGNGVSDLLDEARWQMTFLLKMQVPDGTVIALPRGRHGDRPLPLTRVDAGGMAFHKVADRHWTALPTAPADDAEERLLYPPSTAATLNLAATAAQCARVWHTIDAAFANRCLHAAERAYAAAQRLPDVYAAQGFTGSGGYGDQDLSDEFYWATAELYAATRRPALLRELTRRSAALSPANADRAPDWSATAMPGTITLATAHGVPGDVRAAARDRVVALARRFAAEMDQTGYRIPFAGTAYAWGSNGALLNRGIVLALAARFTNAPALRDAAIATLDYVLGRNPLDQSYVSGFGAKPMTNPHHRYWAHQLDARYPGPPPGALSGGANNTAMADPVSARLKGRCAPQRCWIDDARAYAVNEVAINWNAPLVWMVAWADGGAR